MENKMETHNELDNLLLSFWQTFPPIWHETRSLTHHIALDEFGITAAQFHLMRRIQEGKTSVSTLAECMHLSRPNISRAVDEMVNSKLVERTRDTNDRRNVELSLTAKGQDLLKNLLDRIGSKMKAKFVSLSPDEIVLLESAFNILRRSLISSEKKVKRA